MRRFSALILLTVLALISLPTSADAQQPGRRGPVPTTLTAKASSPLGSAGSLVQITGRLLDADRRPVTGVPIQVQVATPGATERLQSGSMTAGGGAFEAYAPMPDQRPSDGLVHVIVSFGGNEFAEASEITLPLSVEAAPAAAPAEDAAETAIAAVEPAPAVVMALPSSGSPLLDQLIVAALAVFGLMLALLTAGAVRRRRH